MNPNLSPHQFVHAAKSMRLARETGMPYQASDAAVRGKVKAQQAAMETAHYRAQYRKDKAAENEEGYW